MAMNTTEVSPKYKQQKSCKINLRTRNNILQILTQDITK